MTFLPIVERELRVAARHRGPWVVRWLAAGIGMGVVLWILAAGNPGALAGFGGATRTGRMIFLTLSALALAYALLAGIRFTADCLSAEKREGTLGLLFLTDLKSHDIVLGKLAANSIESFCGLLALTPVLMLPVLLGGVTAGEVFRMALVLLNSLFLSLACGLLVSSSVRRESTAMGGTFLLLLLLSLGPLAAFAALRGRVGPGSELLQVLSPISAFSLTNDVTYRSLAGPYWGSLATTHLLSWGALAGASFLVPRLWQDRSGISIPGLAGPLHGEWIRANSAWRQRLRDACLPVNPILWLASRRRFATLGSWIFLGLAVVCWAFMAMRPPLDPFGEPLALFVVLFSSCLVIKLGVANWSAMTFADYRRSGALEDLLVTPLATAAVTRGCRLAAFREFRWVLLAVVALIGAMVVRAFTIERGSSWAGDFVVCAVVNGNLLLTDTIAVFWVGLWQSLRSRTAGQAFIRTSLRVLGLPWVVLFLVGMMGGFRGMHDPLVGWLALGLLNDGLWSAIAYSELQARFRVLALRSPPPPSAGPEVGEALGSP